jgi:hypothetical protein
MTQVSDVAPGPLVCLFVNFYIFVFDYFGEKVLKISYKEPLSYKRKVSDKVENQFLENHGP